jgi:hypothetical protein
MVLVRPKYGVVVDAARKLVTSLEEKQHPLKFTTQYIATKDDVNSLREALALIDDE